MAGFQVSLNGRFRLSPEGSFVHELGKGGKEPAIVSAIVSLARHLGMEVVAEGIETREQLDKLRRIGCGLGQGFLFSRPVSADEARSWFGSKTPVWSDVVGAA